jgi:ABC-2 type transport system permease protein
MTVTSSTELNTTALATTTGRTGVGAFRVNTMSSLWALYDLTLRQYLRGKRWMVVALLFAVPAAMAILVRTTSAEVPAISLEFLLVQMFIPQVLLPFIALLYASGMIRDEQEEQTLTYLLTRPISKWSLYLVKLLATLTMTTSLVAVFTTVAYLAIHFRSSSSDSDVLYRCVVTVAIQALSVICYCSLFGLMSLLTQRTLIIGIVYTVVVEGMLANLPFGIRLFTIIYYARVIAYRTMSFIVPVPGRSDQDFAADAWQFDLRTDPHLLEHPSITTCIAVLGLTFFTCAVLAAWLCSRREFHLKTPESA